MYPLGGCFSETLDNDPLSALTPLKYLLCFDFIWPLIKKIISVGHWFFSSLGPVFKRFHHF